MNLTVSNTNRILRSGNGPTVEYTGQDPIQVNNATHIISLNSAFSAQFAESGVEAKVDELSSCCEQVHSSISSLETQVSSLSSTVETQISALSSTIDTISSEIPDTSDFLTKASADTLYQPIGDYLTHNESGAFQPAGDYILRSESGAFQPSGDYLTTGILNTLATKQDIRVTSSFIQGEVDYISGAISAVSSEIPDVSNFITNISAEQTYQPIGDYQPAGDYATRDEVSSYLLKDEFTETSSFLQTEISSLSAIVTSATDDYELIEGDYIKLTDNSANHTTEISVTGLPNFSDYASTGDLNALSSLVDNLSGDVVSISSTVSSSVTSLSSDIQYVSANCLTAHQSLDDYYKKTETSSKQEISAALASLQPGDAEVQQVVHTYSAEGKWLIASDLDPYLQKSESGVFQPSGNYLSANALEGYATEQWVNEQGFIKTETDWTNTIKEASANAYNEAVAQIPAPFDPTYLSGEIDKKLDKSFSSNFYPMTGNPSGFLTAHQSLEGYATEQWVEDKGYLTAHQDISNLATKDEVSSYLLKSESGNFYPMTGNPSGFLTAHQDLSNYPTRSEISSYATTSQLNTVSSLLSANTITGSKYNTIYISSHNIEGTNSALSLEENTVETTIYKSQSSYMEDWGSYPYTAVKAKSPVNTTALYGLYDRGVFGGGVFKLQMVTVQANVDFDVPMSYNSYPLVGLYSDSNNAIGVTGYYGVSSIRELAWKSDLSSKQNTITYHYIEV